MTIFYIASVLLFPWPSWGMDKAGYSTADELGHSSRASTTFGIQVSQSVLKAGRKVGI
jgi:hypothetical protein